MVATYAVTGCASGIGSELVRILKARGNEVIGFDRRDPGENVDEFIFLDLNDEAAIRNAARSLDFRLDGLCNNAGIPPRPGLESMILQVNFFGTRMFTEEILPCLKPGASIVNVASRAGHGWKDNLEQIRRFMAVKSRDHLERFALDEGLNPARAYNLSKEAMILWSAASTEFLIGRGLRANTLSPGAVATGILDDFRRAFGDGMARNVRRAGRTGTPEEIAQVAAFVLSPESSWLKGTDVAIDGGMGAFALVDNLSLEDFASWGGED